MSAYYSLKHNDGSPFGSFERVRSVIANLFTGVRFVWRQSGADQVREMQSRGLYVPEVLERTLNSVPPIFEAHFEDDRCELKFQLGPSEPVSLIMLQLKGDDSQVAPLLTALESELGAEFVPGGLEQW
jgi:hypothetical protein